MILNKKSKLKGKLLYASKHQEGGIIRVSSYDDPAFKSESDSTASANVSIKMLADMKESLAKYKKARKDRLKLNDDSLPEAVDLYGKEVSAIKKVFEFVDASNANLKKYKDLGIKPTSSEDIKVNDRTTETMSIFKKPSHKVIYVKPKEVKKKPVEKEIEGPTHTMPDGTVMPGATHGDVKEKATPAKKEDTKKPSSGLLYKKEDATKTKTVSVKKKDSSKPKEPYIKKVVGAPGPSDLFYVYGDRSFAINESTLDSKYSHLKDTMKTVKYK
jgi:hypothetical protein